MNDAFTLRVRSATSAAWWTVLIGAIWLTLSWLAGLCLLANRPAWVLSLWGGGGMTWDQAHATMLTFWAVFKLILIAFALLAIWLTLWGRRLKHPAGS